MWKVMTTSSWKGALEMSFQALRKLQSVSFLWFDLWCQMFVRNKSSSRRFLCISNPSPFQSTTNCTSSPFSLFLFSPNKQQASPVLPAIFKLHFSLVQPFTLPLPTVQPTHRPPHPPQQQLCSNFPSYYRPSLINSWSWSHSFPIWLYILPQVFYSAQIPVMTSSERVKAPMRAGVDKIHHLPLFWFILVIILVFHIMWKGFRDWK